MSAKTISAPLVAYFRCLRQYENIQTTMKEIFGRECDKIKTKHTEELVNEEMKLALGEEYYIQSQN